MSGIFKNINKNEYMLSFSFLYRTTKNKIIEQMKINNLIIILIKTEKINDNIGILVVIKTDTLR